MIITSITKICRLPQRTNTLAQLLECKLLICTVSFRNAYTLIVIIGNAWNPLKYSLKYCCLILYMRPFDKIDNNSIHICINEIYPLNISNMKSFNRKIFRVTRSFNFKRDGCDTSILGPIFLNALNRISLFIVNYRACYIWELVEFTTGNANKCACRVIFAALL